MSPLDVRFGPDRILQPDAMVFLEVIPHDIAMPIARIPEICVEVVSTNRTYDRVTKRYAYAEAGVKEYWIVDPELEVVRIYRREGEGFARPDELSREAGDAVSSPLFPDFVLSLDVIFRAAI